MLTKLGIAAAILCPTLALIIWVTVWPPENTRLLNIACFVWSLWLLLWAHLITRYWGSEQMNVVAGFVTRIVVLLAPWVGLGYLTTTKGWHGGSVIVAMSLCIFWDIFIADHFPLFSDDAQAT